MEPRLFQELEAGANVERWVKSTCGVCSIGCGLEVAASDGRIVGVRGRTDHPVGLGRLGPKGLNQWYANRHPARGLHPMVRGRGGNLVRATWNEALEVMCERFTELLATEGPESVAIYNSGQLLLEDYYTLGKLARAGWGTPNIDANTRLCTATVAASLMESFGADGPPGCYADFDETECIVLVGHNAAEQSTVLWMRILAAKTGPKKPKVIVIDPRRTFSVETGADLHLQLRPGTNVALLNGICHLLIEHQWVDWKFIAEHTVLFDEFKAIVAQYPPHVVERITGVPEPQLRLAAQWIGESGSTVITCLQGVYQSNQATAAASTVNSMHLLMGKIGKPGSAPLQMAGQPSSMNTRECGADGAYPAYRNWEDPEHMADLARRWKVSPLILGKKPVPAPDIFDLCEKGVVKALWTVATNPAASMTDRRKTLAVLDDLFLVVQDCFADTETVALADVYLPSAMWGEKTGCMTNAERRCSLVQKVVEPPGEARADLEIFLDVAARMKLADGEGNPLFQYSTPEGAFEEWKMVSKGRIPDYSGMTYQKILERGGIQWPCNEEHPDGTERLYTSPSFPNHWRVAESYNKDLYTGHEHTLNEYKAKHPGDRARLIAANFVEPVDLPDEEFPMTAVAGRVAYHWHTRTKTGRAPLLADAAPDVFVELNARDAARLGIADGDAVRVTSRRGAMTGPAKVGDVVTEGAVFIPFHYGELGMEQSPNNLMPMAWDPVSHQPVQKAAAVRVERARGASARRWWSDDESVAPTEEAR